MDDNEYEKYFDKKSLLKRIYNRFILASMQTKHAPNDYLHSIDLVSRLVYTENFIRIGFPKIPFDNNINTAVSNLMTNPDVCNYMNLLEGLKEIHSEELRKMAPNILLV